MNVVCLYLRVFNLCQLSLIQSFTVGGTLSNGPTRQRWSLNLFSAFVTLKNTYIRDIFMGTATKNVSTKTIRGPGTCKRVPDVASVMPL